MMMMIIIIIVIIQWAWDTDRYDDDGDDDDDVLVAYSDNIIYWPHAITYVHYNSIASGDDNYHSLYNGRCSINY